MNGTLVIVASAVLTLAACRTKSQSQPMGGMVMDERAPVAGAARVAVDTGGATVREPVRLSPAQASAIGITYTVVQRGPLERTVRTVGQILPAESRVAEITAKVDGFAERVLVDATGLTVHRGQPLLTLYSPMLVTAQEELLGAKRLAASLDSSDGDAWRSAQKLLEASRRRLAYWDISVDQIDRIERTGEVTKTLTLAAPFDGVVLEKMVVAGQAVTAGMKLYRVADLSTVWVEGEVFEQDLALVQTGAAARVALAAYPGQSFTGRVSFVYPVVDPQSRTARVRVALANRGGALRPGMYGTLYFDAQLGADLLSVPAEAVAMTGQRNVVFVVGSSGALEPREVTLGARAADRIQVLSGLAEGDRIVASANFLVDAESRLGGSQGMANMPGMSGDTGRERP